MFGAGNRVLPGAHIHSGVYVPKYNNPLYIWLKNSDYELEDRERGLFYNPYELDMNK